MKIHFFLFLILFTFTKVESIETKIIHKIQNEIITSIDIKNEFKYLTVLNAALKELDKEKILYISNDSAIREKIKKIEILKNFKEIKINEEYLNLLLKNIFLSLNLESLDEFKIYLKDYDLTLEYIKNKVTIDAMWNELVVQKYKSRVKINEKKIKETLFKKINVKSKEYKLSEILFEIKNKEEINKKYNEIIKSIAQIGFENSASIYSFSESAKTGGDIGWISENSFNSKIKENIDYLRIGEVSKPIILANGVLILKVTNIKISKLNIDPEAQINEAIKYERNRQLNQYSKIYYNKIKKNLEFDE